MILFIVNSIEDARKIGLAEGQAKYSAYFINTHLYESKRLEVEAMLIQDGYGDCIVTV